MFALSGALITALSRQQMIVSDLRDDWFWDGLAQSKFARHERVSNYA